MNDLDPTAVRQELELAGLKIEFSQVEIDAVITAVQSVKVMQFVPMVEYDAKLRQASKAVETLRDLLPELIRVQEKIASAQFDLDRGDSKNRLHQMRNLQASLINIVEPLYDFLYWNKSYKWRLMATVVFRICKEKFSSGSNSKHGSITRFIVGMARRVGYSLSPATVESYLRDSGLN